MHPEKQEIPATYQLHPEVKRMKITRKMLVTAGITAAIAVAALGLSIVSLLHLDNVSELQATQIRLLDQANTRLAGELSAESTQLSQMTVRLAGADPASDSNLVTCRDLKNMGLVATNGGSVSSVPGPVSLSQSAVPMPGHCEK